MTDPIDLELLRSWIGRSETAQDLVSVNQARAIAATLDLDRVPQAGDPLPPLWHWAYFRPHAPASAIKRDGHPRLGGFLPPIPLPRRMWVGSAVRFAAAPRIGDIISRTSTIADVTLKTGRNGNLVFLTLDHDIHAGESLLIRETQNIVYREAAAFRTEIPPRVLPAEPTFERPEADWREGLTPDPVLLFRYSALTFNGHRIHYDKAYAQHEEGYPGLVVHGPLTATLLVDRLIHKHGPMIKTFTFRAHQPLFCDEPMTLSGKMGGAGAFDLWAETPTGEVAMAASGSY